MPAIAVAGVSPVTGDAPLKGEGETSRSECRLGVAFSPRVIISFTAIGKAGCVARRSPNMAR